MAEKKNYYIKIILLGEHSIGKTALINVYFDKGFKLGIEPTITPTQSDVIIDKNDIKYNITIWDTMGQEKYRAVTKSFIKGSHIVIFVYDITRRETFLELNFWLNAVNEELQNEEVIFGVAANKIDLFENSEVEKEEGEEYAKAINALFCETSAKDNAQGFKDFVRMLFNKVTSNEKIMEKIKKDSNEIEGGIHLEEKNKKNKKGKCC